MGWAITRKCSCGTRLWFTAKENCKICQDAIDEEERLQQIYRTRYGIDNVEQFQKEYNRHVEVQPLPSGTVITREDDSGPSLAIGVMQNGNEP
jgi:hypothetical protein